MTKHPTHSRFRALASFAMMLTLLLPVSAASGQDETPAPPPADDRLSPDNDDEMRQTASLFIVHRMRVALGLSDKQVLELLPLFERIEEMRGQSHRVRRELGEELRQLSKDEGADSARVDAVIAQLDREEERVRAEQNRHRDAILVLLEPHQRAGFILFTQHLRSRMERGMGSRPGSDRPRRGRRGDSRATSPD